MVSTWQEACFQPIAEDGFSLPAAHAAALLAYLVSSLEKYWITSAAVVPLGRESRKPNWKDRSLVWRGRS